MACSQEKKYNSKELAFADLPLNSCVLAGCLCEIVGDCDEQFRWFAR